MGRHTRHERPDDEPVPGASASQEPYYAAPVDPSYQAFSGPTDDRVFVSSYERPRSGPPPAPEGYRFDPLPGDYPGDHPGAPDPAYAPEDPLDGPLDRPQAGAAPEPDGGRGLTKFIAKLPLPLLSAPAAATPAPTAWSSPSRSPRSGPAASRPPPPSPTRVGRPSRSGPSPSRSPTRRSPRSAVPPSCGPGPSPSSGAAARSLPATPSASCSPRRAPPPSRPPAC